MELDVLIVGAGRRIACAIELARLAKADRTELNIGVWKKRKLGDTRLRCRRKPSCIS